MPIYEAIIGMEVHAQLLTRSKMFCGCDADAFGTPPNHHVCPVCLGLPGALPVINRRAIEQALLVGLALQCSVTDTAVFSRKNYFYPDLPKSYQISMYDLPLARGGWVELDGLEGQDPVRIRVRRVHLEEDTAKLMHTGDHSLVDFNRAGVPLLEIVSEPDLRTPEQARQYLLKLQAILRALEVSSADMEKGAMRCEANVSVREAGSEALGTKVEVKNLNSFRSVKLALEYEIARQAQVLDEGGQVRQVTMGWDERHGRTAVQRIKEGADDYRYFPEPDLPPLRIAPAWVEQIRAELPELPDAQRARFVRAYGLSRVDAAVLAADREVAAYFEAAAAAGRAEGIAPQTIANWITGELFRLLRAEAGETPARADRLAPEALAGLIALVERGVITTGSGKTVLGEMFATGRSAEQIVAEKGLAQVSDEAGLARVVDEVLAAHPEEVAHYLAGKETLGRWFVGQVMRATEGKANPQVVTALVEKRLRNPQG